MPLFIWLSIVRGAANSEIFLFAIRKRFDKASIEYCNHILFISYRCIWSLINNTSICDVNGYFQYKKKSYPFFKKKKKGIRTGSSLSSALAKKEITHKVGNRKILGKRLIFNRSETCQKSEIQLLFHLPSPRSGEKTGSNFLCLFGLCRKHQAKIPWKKVEIWRIFLEITTTEKWE